MTKTKIDFTAPPTTYQEHLNSIDKSEAASEYVVRHKRHSFQRIRLMQLYPGPQRSMVGIFCWRSCWAFRFLLYIFFYTLK